MRTSFPTRDDHGTTVPETPLRLLIKTYPDLAEMVFNNSIKKIKKVDGSEDEAQFGSPKRILEMDYEFIDDAYLIRPPDASQGRKILT